MSDGSPTQPSSVLRAAPTFSKTTFHFLAGLTSGLTSSVLLQPADLLKTRVQQSGSSALLPTLRAIISGPNPITSLWRGTLPSALRTGFGSALYFTTLNALRTSVARSRLEKSGPLHNVVLASVLPTAKSSSALPKLSHLENLTTGAAARTFAGLIMMPVTVLKVRYESSYYSYTSLWGACRDILRKEGPKGFFAGFGATAVRDAPYAGLYVVFYEGSKKRLATFTSSRGNDGTVIVPTKSRIAATHFMSGILAAGLATAVTNPFDAVKTRLQLQPAKYRNMVHATKLMLKEDGAKSLLDGLGLRMGRKALSSALAWTVYEDLISRAERRFEEAKEGVL